MSNSKPFTPTADDLRLLSEHLCYELQMTFSLAAGLESTAGTVFDQWVRNARIEALTMHVRQTIDFLWGDRSNRRARDAYAADYFAPGEWARLRPARPAILSEALRSKVGWGVAHLTYRRARVTPQEKQWDVIGIARGLAPAVRCFADSVDPAKLDPAFVAAIKAFGQRSGSDA